jgi:hypothetical protein
MHLAMYVRPGQDGNDFMPVSVGGGTAGSFFTLCGPWSLLPWSGIVYLSLRKLKLTRHFIHLRVRAVLIQCSSITSRHVGDILLQHTYFRAINAYLSIVATRNRTDAISLQYTVRKET